MFQSDKNFKGVDLDTVVQQNPMVDMKQVNEAKAILEKLRSLGITRPGYRLMCPFTPFVPEDDSHQSE